MYGAHLTDHGLEIRASDCHNFSRDEHDQIKSIVKCALVRATFRKRLPVKPWYISNAIHAIQPCVVHATYMPLYMPLVVVIFALGVGVVLYYEVFCFLFDAGPAAAICWPRGSCVDRGRFLGYRVASVDPV